MKLRVKTLIAATALATLSATCAYAQATEYGTWNDGSMAGGPMGGTGSQIQNSQVNLQTNWSNLNGNIDTVAGDAAVQGAAGGNLMDITTMNNTMVNSSQIVGPGASIGSNVITSINNIGGSVGIQNQAVCNGLSVSTDPTYASTRNYQECNAADPSTQINATVTNIYGDAAIPGLLARQYLRGGLQCPEHADLEQADQQLDGRLHGQCQCLQYRRLDQPDLQRDRQYRPDHPLQHPTEHLAAGEASTLRRTFTKFRVGIPGANGNAE